MAQPLIMSGLARGGTNMVARMLCTHPQANVAIHALQPAVKTWRNAVVARDGGRDLQVYAPPESPFHDGHFNGHGPELLRLLHAAELDIAVPTGARGALRQAIVNRASDECRDLIEAGLGEAASQATFVKLFDSALGILAETRKIPSAGWAGLLDTWTIDLFPAAARAWSEARFIIILRDPRGIAASMLGVLEQAPDEVAHILSVVRQWRKYAALVTEFRRDPKFSERLLVVRYENLVRDPETAAREICTFLNIESCADMCDFTRYVDPATGAAWSGNSTFSPAFARIDGGAAERWRDTLDKSALAAIEFCCGADMMLMDYKPVTGDIENHADEVLEFLRQDSTRRVNWRSDSGDPDRDFENECARRAALAGRASITAAGTDQAFLSDIYYHALMVSPLDPGNARKGTCARVK